MHLLAALKSLRRFRILLLLAAISITYSTLTRLTLMALAHRAAELDLAGSLAVLASGVAYDLLFCLFAAVPLSLWLMMPERLWQSRLNRGIGHALTFSLIYVLGFIAAAEIVFWQEFGVRFNFIAVDYLVYTTEVMRNVWESYRVVWVLLGNLGVTAIVYAWLSPRLWAPLHPACAWPRELAVGALLWGLALGCAASLDEGPRAGFTNTFRKELGSNGPYQFISAFRHNELDYAKFYPVLPLPAVDRHLRREIAEPTATFRGTQSADIRRHIDNAGTPRRLNVVLIMVESLSAKFMGHFSPAHRWTPELDRLADRSLSFDAFYATGTRTDRGLEAVTLSVPPTPGRSIVKRAGHETGLWSLGNVLDAQGYESTFVYGGRGYFDNMNAFFAGNGYHIVDQTSVPADEVSFENAWGMADEDLYRQVIRIANDAHHRSVPFFMHVMTTSNHRPYTFPDGRIALPSGSGRPGAVQYTDWAIGNFLHEASLQPWFEDTVFVIVGDHCASSAGKVDLPAHRYHIPLMFYSPAHVQAARIPTVASQIDLAPTLLALLHLDYESAFFGKDILAMREQDGRALIANYQYLGLLAHDEVTVLGPRQPVRRHAASASGVTLLANTASPDTDRAIAYYQGASHAFREGLMDWQPSAAAAPASGAGHMP